MSSSMIIIPDELLQNLDVNHAWDDAIYNFNLNTAQREIITRLYKGKEYQNIQLQMQFLQSSNQLAGIGSSDEAKQWVRVTIMFNELEEYQQIDISGTFYSIAEFNSYLLPKLSLWAQHPPKVNDDILQNEGLFNIYLQSDPPTVVKMQFHGYQLIQMLGLSHGTETDVEWVWQINETAVKTGVRHFFCPVIKQFQIESSLQQRANIYYDERGAIHNIVARVINSIQQGDFANIVANIQMPAVNIDQLFSFRIAVYDQNFFPCKFLDEFKVCLTFSDVGGSGALNSGDVQKIISNRSV